MLPLSANIPKTMLQVQGQPLLGYVIDGLLACDVDQIVVVIGEGEFFTPVLRYLRLGDFDRSVKIEVVTQRAPGVSGAILSAKNEFQGYEKLFLAHGDIMATPNFYTHLKSTVDRTGADGGIAMTLKSSIEDFGVCVLDATRNVAKVVEHPGLEQARSLGNYVGAGAYIFPTSYFSYLERAHHFGPAINEMINDGRRLSAAIFSEEGEWMDIGTPYDLLTANAIQFQQYQGSYIHSTAQISPMAHISGPVKVEAGAVVEHGAIIKGPCYIGKDVYVGNNCLIRDNTSIEEGCNIGFSVELKNTHLQPFTNIGRLSFVGDSIVGRNVEIRSGVTIMNHYMEGDDFVVRGTNFGKKIGAVVGDRAEIGANAVLEPKTSVQQGEFVPPGVVISPTD